MDEKRGSGRLKRHSKNHDEGFWDCSVCTYKNSPEAYKCEMCDIRKGTSTRKPRLNAQLVAQQVAQQFAPTPPKKEKSHSSKKEKDHDLSDSSSKDDRPPRLKNIDRSSATQMAVTVGNVTVVITDYQPKLERRTSTDTQNNILSDHSDSNSSSGTSIYSPEDIGVENN